MIPIGDSVRSRTFPYVNLAIIIANFLVFFYELSLGNDVDSFLRDWGVVPRFVTDYFDNPGDYPYRVLFTPITAMFIHGGWFHILGNMLFLWVFGDNVEDAIGHVSYLFFYVLGGIAAATAQIWVDTGSAVPMVGASGAIAAVLGGYVVLYPRATVAAVIFPFFFWAFPVPAFVLIGLWFFLQLSLRRGVHRHGGGRQRGRGLVGAHRRVPGRAGADLGVPWRAVSRPTRASW